MHMSDSTPASILHKSIVGCYQLTGRYANNGPAINLCRMLTGICTFSDVALHMINGVSLSSQGWSDYSKNCTMTKDYSKNCTMTKKKHT